LNIGEDVGGIDSQITHVCEEHIVGGEECYVTFILESGAIVMGPVDYSFGLSFDSSSILL